jgi:hypothetical protein
VDKWIGVCDLVVATTKPVVGDVVALLPDRIYLVQPIMFEKNKARGVPLITRAVRGLEALQFHPCCP